MEWEGKCAVVWQWAETVGYIQRMVISNIYSLIFIPPYSMRCSMHILICFVRCIGLMVRLRLHFFIRFLEDFGLHVRSYKVSKYDSSFTVSNQTVVHVTTIYMSSDSNCCVVQYNAIYIFVHNMLTSWRWWLLFQMCLFSWMAVELFVRYFRVSRPSWMYCFCFCS